MERKRGIGWKVGAPGLIRRTEEKGKSWAGFFGGMTDRREGNRKSGCVKINLPRNSNLIGVGSVQEK